MKEIIKQWREEAFGDTFHETTAFHIEGDNIYIITKYPGFFIGYHGELIDKYKEKIGKAVTLVDIASRNSVEEF